MKISIVIPIYNVEKYLPRCVESVLNQSYENLEIILVNDGSPDNSGVICDLYAKSDDRVVVVHQVNRGLSGARNAGMRIMTGDYVYFLDSDDYINHDTIEILSKRLEGQDGPDIIIGKINMVNEKGELYYPKISFQKHELDQDDFTNSREKFKYFFGKSYGTSACNKLYKCSFLRDLGLEFEPNDMIYAEDFLFNLKVFINRPTIQLVDEYTYNYFYNTNSIQNTFKKNLGERYSNLIKSFVDYAVAHDQLDIHQDLLAFSTFTAIDVTLLNIYNYSDAIFSDMYRELQIFKTYGLFQEPLKSLAKGKYLDEVPRKDWSWFVRLFAILYTHGFLRSATCLQYVRHKVLELTR